MSHLRDLQKLRNTRQNYPIKKNINPFYEQTLKSEKVSQNPYKNQNYHQNQLVIPEILGRNMELNFERDSQDLYSKYLHSKEITTGRDLRDQHLPRTSQNKLKHKRGSSYAYGNTYYQRSKDANPQSGLSVYTFQLKMSNPQSSGHSTHLSRRSNPLTFRKQKVPQLFLHQQDERKKFDIKKRKQSKILLQLKDEGLQSKNSFQVLYPIGKGGFGKVWKVRCKRNGQIFAMKQMQKAKIINKKSINSVMNQRNLLSQLHHPFLVNMKSSFQDRENLYLIMDYLNGGDMRYHIGCRSNFSQHQTKFFMANIILALEYLHSKRIIHRDLKPQNFVLDQNGYLHITDLGVSRKVKDDNSQDTSGTPGYMSPEVICNRNHSYTADYFALGVIGYEFMLGRRPYNGRNRKEIRDHILTKQAEIKIDQLPYKWSPQAANFINALLQRNPQNRLGFNGIQQIKYHPWMVDVDWKAMKQKSLKSPFVPLTIQQNYDDYKQQISEDTIDKDVEETRIMLRDSEVQELFKGYQFKMKKNYSLCTTNYTDSEYGSCK